MIIIGINYNKDLVYLFSENKTIALELYSKIKKNTIKDGEKNNGYTTIIYDLHNNKYYFFYSEYKNIKDARHVSKLLLNAVIQSHAIFYMHKELYNEDLDIIQHNTRNIIHDTTNGMRELLSFNELLKEKDKVSYIKKLISDDPTNFAREFLRCEKSLEQVSYEYDCINFLQSNELLDSSNRSSERIHSCLVQAFYIYENDFVDKNIRVKINTNYDSMFCNFFSMRSAFALIFENCTKYCKENSPLDVSIEHVKDGSIKIDFDMISVYNTDEELKSVFLEHFRGSEAKKKEAKNNEAKTGRPRGKGLGLYIANQLMNINGFSICMRRIPNSEHCFSGIHYSRNIFIIDIPSKYINVTS